MCLERAFSGYLAYFFKVGLRGDTKGPKRGTPPIIGLKRASVPAQSTSPAFPEPASVRTSPVIVFTVRILDTG
jgi:hypothetical protein